LWAVRNIAPRCPGCHNFVTRLLLALTWALARERKVSFVSEAFKHVAAALAVILVSRGVGVLLAVQIP